MALESLIKKYYLTRTPIVGYALQGLCYDFFYKLHSLTKRGLMISGGQPYAKFPGLDLHLFQISLKLIQ